MSRASRDKGKRGEREAAAEIRRLFGTEAERGRQYQGRDRHSCLIFASGVKHGQHVANVLADMGGRECGFVCGDTPMAERDELLDRLRAGELKAIDEGWDLTQCELEVLRASRPAAPAAHVQASAPAPQVFEVVALSAWLDGGRLSRRRCR